MSQKQKSHPDPTFFQGKVTTNFGGPGVLLNSKQPRGGEPTFGRAPPCCDHPQFHAARDLDSDNLPSYRILLISDRSTKQNDHHMEHHASE